MSVKVSAWAWEHSGSTGAAFLVLLALADYAGHDGGDCYPSVATLARRCRLGERTVQTALRTLVELGELKVVDKGGKGPGHTARYKILMGADSAPLAGDKGADDDAKGADDSGKGRSSRTRTVSNRYEPRASSASPLATLRNQRAVCQLCEGTFNILVGRDTYVQCECVRKAS